MLKTIILDLDGEQSQSLTDTKLKKAIYDFIKNDEQSLVISNCELGQLIARQAYIQSDRENNLQFMVNGKYFKINKLGRIEDAHSFYNETWSLIDDALEDLCFVKPRNVELNN